MSNPTKNVRGTPEKNRKANHVPSAFPFDGGLNLEEPGSATVYLAKFNKAMADVEVGMMASGLRPGMAGYDDVKSGQTGYGVPSPGLDAAPAGLFIKKV